jgi:HEAT repeat protein
LRDETSRESNWCAVLKNGSQEERMDALTEVGTEAARQICVRTHGMEEGPAEPPGLLSAELRDAVLEHLKDASPEVKAEAALAAAAWNDEVTAAALQALLGEAEDDDVRRAAAQSLSAVYSASATGQLLTIAEDKRSGPALREQALASYAAVSTRASAAEAPSIVFGAVRTQGRTRGEAQSVEKRLAAIEKNDDETPYVRFLAARARSAFREAKGA